MTRLSTLLACLLIAPVAWAEPQLAPGALDIVVAGASNSRLVDDLGAGLLFGEELPLRKARAFRSVDGEQQEGEDTSLFDPPYGSTDDLALGEAAASLGLIRPFLALQEPEVPGPVRDESAFDDTVTTPFSVRGAIGFTLDPETFLLAGEVDYFFNDSFAAGPLLQFGVSDDDLILMPSVNFLCQLDLSQMSEEPGGALERLKPFAQGGIGFAFIDKDNRFGDDDDIGFMFNVGFGIDYYLAESFAVGNNLLFNIMPDDVVGENFLFTWQFVSVRYRF